MNEAEAAFASEAEPEDEKEVDLSEQGKDVITDIIDKLTPESFKTGQSAFLESMKERKARAMAWVNAEAEADPVGLLVYFSIFLLLVTMAKGFAEWLSRYHLAYAFFFVTLKMREDLFHHILGQDYLFFSKHQPGYLISRVNSDVCPLPTRAWLLHLHFRQDALRWPRSISRVGFIV